MVDMLRWPVLGTVTDPAFQAAVNAALALKADKSEVLTTARATAGEAAMDLLGDEEGIAFDFIAESAAIRDKTTLGAGSLSTEGRPADLLTVARASTATYVGRDRLLKTAPINTLRYEYDPATGVPNGLRLEPAATNMLLRSSDLSSSWTTVNITPAHDAVVAPDGTTTADTITENTATAVEHYTDQTVSVTAGTVYCSSWWVKNVSGSRFAYLRIAVSALAVARFDLSSGTVAATLGADYIANTAKIVSYPNGWYRVSLAYTAAATGNVVHRMHLHNGATTSYDGDGTSAFALWGAQMEAGVLSPTSYIPTTTATATRTADSAPSIATTAFPFDPARMTMYYEMSSPVVLGVAAFHGGLTLSGTSGNYITCGKFNVPTSGNATIASPVVTSSITEHVGSTVTSATVDTVYKSVLSLAGNDAYANTSGTVASADASVALPTVTSLRIGGSTTLTAITVPMHVRKAMVITRNETDSEAAALVA